MWDETSNMRISVLAEWCGGMEIQFKGKYVAVKILTCKDNELWTSLILLIGYATLVGRGEINMITNRKKSISIINNEIKNRNVRWNFKH